MENPAAESLPKGSIASTKETLIHVLHVDDEAGLLKVAKPILEMQGSFHVETALSVKEAMQKIEEKPFDVVVSDYVMPERNGLDFLKELRDGGNNIPFIMFTGKGREEVAIQALNLGADRYFNKIGHPEAVYGELAYGIYSAVRARRAEEELRKFKTISDKAGYGVTLLDLDGSILYVNESCAKMHGYNVNELVGKNHSILHTKQGFDLVERSRKELFEKSYVVMEERHLKKDGSLLPVLVNASLIRDTKGSPLHVTVVITDITERKRIEQQLKESEEKYRKQFEEAMDAIFLADAETGIIVDCNRAATKLVGRKKSELVGKHQRILHPPEEIEGEFSRTFKQHITEKEGDVLEAQVITKTGKIKAVAIKANLFELGDKILVQGVFRDITKNKKMEEQMRRERETLELVTGNIGAGLTIISKDYKILWANKFLKNFCGDVKGKTCYSVYNDRTSICPGCGVKEIFERGKNHVVHEQSVPGPDGQRVWIEITANPIRDEKRNIVAASELSVYVNERKQLENKLREAEKRYHALFDKAPLGILIIDSNATAVEFNEEAHRQLGYSREEFEKLTVSDYEVLESVEETTAHMKKILKTGKDEFETKHRTKMGEIRDIINTVQVIELSGKKFLHVITRDITEQKKAKEALRESEKEKSVVLDSMSELVSHQDLKHRILWANKKAADSVNMKVEQLKGHYCHEIWANSVNPCTDCPLEETIKTGQPQQGEITTPDGRVWSISGYPIKDTNGNVTSIVEVATEITTQKKTEEALRESEKKYRELLNGMNDTAWVIDLDGNIIDVNDVAVEVLGYSRDEFRSIGLTGIDSNLDPEEIKGLVEGMPADEIQVFETAHTTKDGKKIPVEISSSLVTYRGKQAILCIARDITERKRAEEKLSQSEERYRTVFENTGTAMCILEEDKTISMVNKRFEELSGYSWKELEGKKWTELVTKEYLERMKRYHEARRKKGGKPPAHYNFDFVNKKGQIRNSMLTINLIPGTKKSIASIQDITEQKKTEKALQEAEEKYQKAIVNANVGIIGYSPDGEVKILNPKMEQMTGFKRSEIPTLQDWFKKLYPNEEERRKVRDKWFKRMSEEGEVKGGHAIIATKDGKRRNFLFNGVQLESGDSIAFADDITERKEAEEKLEGMMNEVVTINEKLGVVGRLTRHDARNKLSVIANNVYLAKQRLAGNNNALDYLGDIESAIGQMEEIFDFARTYEMLGVEGLSYVDVEKSVKEAAMLFSGLDGAKLVNECQGLTVLADSLLRQLFYNLIDDTLKHGETVSQIRVYYKEVGEDQLKLVYEDDGVGIPEDEKEKIFGEGYGKGTGYGLYLIRKICEAYGWTIQETGKPGKGAQFTMTIPKTNLKGKIAYQLQ